MKKNRVFRAFAVIIFITIIYMSSLSWAEEVLDIPNDWSRKAIEYSLNRNYIEINNGKIDPNKDLTREELISILNRSIGNKNEKNVINEEKLSNYKDLNKEDKYYKDLSQAISSGLVIGDGNYIRPKDSLTREEAFVLIDRVLNLNNNNKKSFKDHDNISSWALDSIYSIYEAGYIKGNENYIRPKDRINKKEILQIIYNIENNSLKINTREKLRHILYETLLNFDDEVLIESDVYSLKDIENIIYRERIITEILLKNPGINYGYNAVDIKEDKDEIKIKIFYTTAHMTYFDEDKLIELSKDREDMINEKKIVEEKIKKIISEIIKDEMTNLEKEKVIHDWIVLNSSYDKNDKKSPYRRNNYTPYGVLIEGLGVCESYAKSFYLLGKEAGLEVLYVTGYSGEYHAWNMIKLDDGKWYHVDTTWDDLGEEDIRYKYFNLNDEALKKTHKIYDDLIKYPKADGSMYYRDKLDFIEK